MALISTPLPDNRPQVIAVQNALSALGPASRPGELGTTPSSGILGPVTQAAVRTFRANYGLPPLPGADRPADLSHAMLPRARR